MVSRSIRVLRQRYLTLRSVLPHPLGKLVMAALGSLAAYDLVLS